MMSMKETIHDLREKNRLLEQAPNRVEEVKGKVERFKNMLDQIFIKVESLSDELVSIKH
jgi:phage-related tail protein